jgi:cytochrome c-type biogenesis protein CcmH/NrfF
MKGRGSKTTGALAATLAVGTLLALTSAPATAAPEDVANDIAGQVVSPYCPGVTLHDCPSAAAVELRDKIETRVAAGATKAEVLDWLESEYGTTIKAAPKGFLAYVLPVLAIVAGLGIVVLATRRWTKKKDPPPPAISPDDSKRLEAELSTFRGSQ